MPDINDLEIRIDSDRLVDELLRLAEFSDAPAPAITRVLFTETDLAAREFLKRLFEEDGLIVRDDPVGNIFARWPGSEPGLPGVGTGSHTDAIPHSGLYDGTVGVLGALEAMRALRRSGYQPRRSIELLMFTAEEPTRFSLGCLGSRLLTGAMTAEDAAQLKDEEDKTLEEVRLQAGCAGSLNEVRLNDDHYRAFVELHIEQGPILERENLAIGIVTAIAAPAAVRVVYQGPGGHAGAVLMSQRADSLLAGAELAIAVEKTALSQGGQDTVSTTGVLDVHPRAINSIPSQVKLEIDVRDIELARRDRVLAEIRRQAQEIGERRNQATTIEPLNTDPPATCDATVVGAITDACEQAGLAYKKMISRAYHDSVFMAALAPTAMIFIPCRDGVSHRPDEYTPPAAITAGVRALALTLARLSSD